MHVRFTTCRGAPVTEWGGDTFLGVLSGLLIHPDTGRLEGVFVRGQDLHGSAELFCAAEDITHWGVTLQIRSADALAPLQDRIRLAALAAEGRTVLGQRIRTESGRSLGVCRDVQVDTERLRVEWLFPRRFLRWGVALPFTEVLEVRRDAVIVRDPAAAGTATESETAVAFEGFPELMDPVIPKPTLCAKKPRRSGALIFREQRSSSPRGY